MRALRIVLLLVLIGTGGLADQPENPVNAVLGADSVWANPVREWAIVELKNPTKVLDSFLQGKYVFEHDAQRMARGEPCTAIYEVTSKGEVKLVVAFHCIPKERTIVDRFTMTTYRSPETPSVVVLTEYQFAGDTEGHGVPIAWRVRRW